MIYKTLRRITAVMLSSGCVCSYSLTQQLPWQLARTFSTYKIIICVICLIILN